MNTDTAAPAASLDDLANDSLTPAEVDALVAARREAGLPEVRVSRTVTSFSPSPADLVDGERYRIEYVDTRRGLRWYVTRTHFGTL